MKYCILGKSGIEISTVVLGTWQAGKSMWAGIDDSKTKQAIQAAVDAGITTIDTAEAYGDGHSERIIAEAVGHLRSRLVIAAKVYCNHLAFDEVLEACRRSLHNLKTDYIDLYQIHWPAGSWGSRAVPIEETMRAMNELKRQGKIRAIGVSNFSKNQLKEALSFGPVESLQPPYSLLWRHVEKDAAPFCRTSTISILAYSPMAQGLLTGKFGPDHRFAKQDHRRRNRLMQPEHFKRVQDVLERLRPLALRHGVSLGQLALAWVCAQPGVCAIAGARDAAQAKENAEAADISLSPEDLSEMDAIGRTVTDHLDDDPVLWR